MTTITNRERLGLALFLQAPWGGDEASLNKAYDLREALDLEEYDTFFVNTPDGLHVSKMHPRFEDDKVSREVEIPQEMAQFVLDRYPQVTTPATLGPTKVRLIRKMRALIPAPAPTPEKPQPAAEPAAA